MENNKLTIFCQLEAISEYLLFKKELEKYRKEEEFKQFCLEIMDNELHKQLEFV